jgi:heme A synthase
MSRYQLLAIATPLATLALIAVGAVVRTTDSGLGCPDWPLCHGELLPPAERTAIIEYSHRTLAALVGLLVLTLAFVTLRHHRGDRLLAGLAVASLPLLALQAWLGKETVERELPAEVVATHLGMAMVLLSVLVSMAVFAVLGPDRRRIDTPERRSILRLGMVSGAAVFVVILGGAYVVGSGSTTACLEWPGCSAAPIPFVDGLREQHIHWLHRLLVLVALLAVVALALRVRASAEAGPGLRNASAALVGLYVFQVLLGALNIWTDFSEAALVLHLAGGSSVWALSVALVVGGRYEPSRRRAAVPTSTARKQARPAGA